MVRFHIQKYIHHVVLFIVTIHIRRAYYETKYFYAGIIKTSKLDVF